MHSKIESKVCVKLRKKSRLGKELYLYRKYSILYRMSRKVRPHGHILAVSLFCLNFNNFLPRGN